LSPKNYSILIFSLAIALSACSQDAEQQQTSGMSEPVEQPGAGEQIGKQIDQAMVDLKQKAQEAETRLGDKLIEAGKALKEGEESAPATTR
jgi:hypothetical protein